MFYKEDYFLKLVKLGTFRYVNEKSKKELKKLTEKGFTYIEEDGKPVRFVYDSTKNKYVKEAVAKKTTKKTVEVGE